MSLAINTIHAAVSLADIKKEVRTVYRQKLEHVLGNINAELMTFKMTFKIDLTKLDIPEKASYFKCPDPKINDLLGTQIQPIFFYDRQGTLLERQTLLLKIEATTKMPVTKHLIQRGKMITESDLIMKEKLIYSKLSTLQNYIFTKEEMIGKIAKRSIPKNTQVHYLAIEEKPAIQKGDPISILINKKWGQIKVDGQALADGQIGGYIPVTSKLSTLKRLKGKVIDEKNIYID
ncbi:MAG: flagellar basal body P-ring formation chaperone FlgA [bacterium]